MGTGYTRNDTTNNIADGNVINADDLDGEFDALQSAFNNTTGHTHDGTTAEGAPITVTGPAQEYVSTGTEFRPKVDDTYDLGSASNQWRNLYVDGVANIDSLVADTATVNGNITVTGTVDGRDVAADGSKLDGIEANAKDDQTITAGSGLTGGGTGDVTISHADTSAQASVNNSGATVIQDVTLDTYGHITALGSTTITPALIGAATSAQGTLADSATQPGDNISTLTNDAGYTTNIGDITGVTAGSGLTGGGTSGAVTVSHADTSSQASVNNSGVTYIQDVTLDTYGHVTALGSGTVTLSGLGYTGATNADNYSSWSARDADGTTYTVTSGDILQFAEGTGIDVNFTADDVLTITNTAPDQVVSLTQGANITITGTYPNFTIAATDTNTTYSAGTGLNLVGTTFNNTAPDQVVSLTGSGGTNVSGTYPNFTISSTDTTYSAGALLDLSGTTFAVDLSELTDMTAAMVGTDEFVVLDASAQRRKAASEIGLSIFNNDAGFTTNVGDITGVTAGTGLSGGGTSGTVTVSHADTSTQASVNNSGTTVIQDVTLDTYGHVTGLGSATLSLGSFGVTATATELNYTDGVTSNIQTQLNSKANNTTQTQTTWDTGTSTTESIVSPAKVKAAVDSQFNVSGSAPKYACRAWVNFNGGTSPATIRASGNVSSVTRSATGRFTINFATAMPDANYSIVGSLQRDTNNTQPLIFAVQGGSEYNPTTTSCPVITPNDNSNLNNPRAAFVAVFR